MLAKNPRPPLGIWFYALPFTIFASKLAPTRSMYIRKTLLGRRATFGSPHRFFLQKAVWCFTEKILKPCE
ncbi:hypothetical protein ACYZUD_11385 [Pseudomonas sp. XS1P51]